MGSAIGLGRDGVTQAHYGADFAGGGGDFDRGADHGFSWYW